MLVVPDKMVTCPSDHIVAYLAGFFDGEGCVRVAVNRAPVKNGNSPVHHLVIVVAQRLDKREPLLMLMSKFGGTIHKAKTRPGCYPMARWVADGEHAAIALQAMLPYLLVKRPAAYAGLAFQHWKSVMRLHRKRHERLSQFEIDVAEGFMKLFYTINGNKPIDDVSLGLVDADSDPKTMLAELLKK